MSTQFSDRKKGFEAKFQMDQETTFKVEARRNKLLGLWLAEELGMPETEHEAYAKDVVLADLEEPGVEDIIRKVMKDITDHDANVSEADVRQKLNDLHATAYEQIIAQ